MGADSGDFTDFPPSDLDRPDGSRAAPPALPPKNSPDIVRLPIQYTEVLRSHHDAGQVLLPGELRQVPQAQSEDPLRDGSSALTQPLSGPRTTHARGEGNPDSLSPSRCPACGEPFDPPHELREYRGLTLIGCPKIPEHAPWYALPIKLDLAAILQGVREALAGTRRIEEPREPSPVKEVTPTISTAQRCPHGIEWGYPCQQCGRIPPGESHAASLTPVRHLLPYHYDPPEATP